MILYNQYLKMLVPTPQIKIRSFFIQILILTVMIIEMGELELDPKVIFKIKREKFVI